MASSRSWKWGAPKDAESSCSPAPATRARATSRTRPRTASPSSCGSVASSSSGRAERRLAGIHRLRCGGGGHASRRRGEAAHRLAEDVLPRSRLRSARRNGRRRRAHLHRDRQRRRREQLAGDPVRLERRARRSEALRRTRTRGGDRDFEGDRGGRRGKAGLDSSCGASLRRESNLGRLARDDVDLARELLAVVSRHLDRDCPGASEQRHRPDP